MKGKYDDILNLPHHVSAKRPRMPMSDRAAQFSPFAALTGYDAAIKETGRLTDEKIEQGEEALSKLNLQFQILLEHLDQEPRITLTYFQPDARKSGGAYRQISGRVIALDEHARQILLRDGTKIPMDSVLRVEGEIFPAGW